MEFLDFGKNTAYIWWSFGLTFAVLLANVFIAFQSHRKMLREVRRQGDNRS